MTCVRRRRERTWFGRYEGRNLEPVSTPRKRRQNLADKNKTLGVTSTAHRRHTRPSFTRKIKRPARIQKEGNGESREDATFPRVKIEDVSLRVARGTSATPTNGLADAVIECPVTKDG